MISYLDRVTLRIWHTAMKIALPSTEADYGAVPGKNPNRETKREAAS